MTWGNENDREMFRQIKNVLVQLLESNRQCVEYINLKMLEARLDAMKELSDDD